MRGETSSSMRPQFLKMGKSEREYSRFRKSKLGWAWLLITVLGR